MLWWSCSFLILHAAASLVSVYCSPQKELAASPPVISALYYSYSPQSSEEQ